MGGCKVLTDSLEDRAARIKSFRQSPSSGMISSMRKESTRSPVLGTLSRIRSNWRNGLRRKNLSHSVSCKPPKSRDFRGGLHALARNRADYDLLARIPAPGEARQLERGSPEAAFARATDARVARGLRPHRAVPVCRPMGDHRAGNVLRSIRPARPTSLAVARTTAPSTAVEVARRGRVKYAPGIESNRVLVTGRRLPRPDPSRRAESLLPRLQTVRDRGRMTDFPRELSREGRWARATT
jgi:hypothetical protein